MFGPSDERVRSPAVAGLFYPADAAACQQVASEFVRAGRVAAAGKTLPSAGMGAIVPHAGWICSGAIAGEALASLAAPNRPVDLVVVFGAIHTPMWIDRGVLDPHLRWAIPGRDTEVTIPLVRALAEKPGFVMDERFHRREHAVEVQVPLIQALWPAARLLPIETPPDASAVELGRTVAKAVAAAGAKAVYLASSDLTHYGPNYRFTPAGIGAAALAWAMDNDRRLLRIVTDMTPENILPEACSRNNACGAGAIAAMMAACLESGARQAVVLRHASSYQTLAEVGPRSADNAVGYAAVWVG